MDSYIEVRIDFVFSLSDEQPNYSLMLAVSIFLAASLRFTRNFTAHSSFILVLGGKGAFVYLKKFNKFSLRRFFLLLFK